MNLTRVAAILLRHFYLMRGSVARIMPTIAWGAVDILLWGYMTKYLGELTGPGLHFVPMLLGAVLFWNFLTRVMHGVSIAFFEDIWSRNFLNIFSSPLSISEYLLGLVLSGIATSTLALLVMLLIAFKVFGLSVLVYGPMLLPFLLVLILFGVALGIVSTAMVLRMGPASEWFVWPIPALISPFVGVFYPVTLLPTWVQPISRLLPPSYVFENLRAIAMGGAGRMDTLLIGMGIAVIYIMLASWIFVRTYRLAMRTGLIARYSAESVT